MKHVVIGTAGHVDHGKTALVRALTGVDTDRLAEEKRRGLTIELGFARLDFPDGSCAGVVDVPGHEKFIKTMLAGAGGIDLAMLVVAADEGFMPQTVEHLNILSLLGVRRGVVVLTKCDLADADWLAMARAELAARVKGTFLENAPVVETSAATGQGIEDLREMLHALVRQTREKSARVPFRLPIDRVFSVDGFGTVVTGTLIEGALHVGGEAELLSSGTRSRVRNLQVHGENTAIAVAGQRVAVNLAGIKKTDVIRGDTLAEPDSVRVSRLLDVRLSCLRDSERTVENGSRVHFCHGTAARLAKVVLLDRDALAPGESHSILFGLGYIENPQQEKFIAPGVINKTRAHAMMERYATDAQVDAARAALRTHWEQLLSTYHLESGEEKLNRMVNIWHQYQCMVTFNMSRSASYYESGTGRGMGFRDSCQDLLGFVHIIPSRARERILDIAATQFEDGSAYHQYQPLTKKGNRDIGTGFNDDPLWLIAGTAAYLRETGDWSILEEQVPFDNDATKAQTLMEHLRRSFNFTCTHLGPHGLPLIGRADWNDCLNLNCFSEHPGESFQITGPSEGPVAESVFIAGMFVKYGHEYAQLCDHLNLTEEAAAARKHIDAVEQATLTAGWDGAWFRRAYDAFGKPIGSKECTEGQIFIEPQGMCVMAGIGKESGQAAQALASVEERLDTKYGVVLLQPAYTSYQLNLGEISSYPPGYKENAGIFCHNNPWISCAEATLGHGDRAFAVYRKTCPAYIEDISEIHRTEPYVYSQMVAGKDAPTFGEAKNSWLTGTAAWTFFNISQYILGIQPTLDGLKVDPCIPHTLSGFTVTRRFRGAVYHITVDNAAGVQHGIKAVTVDGKAISGNVLPLAAAGTEVTVQVTMG